MLNISRQAYLYTITIIITTVINMIIAISLFGLYGFLTYLLFLVFAVPLFLLAIYNIDCLTTGGCNIWSWILSIFSIIGMVLSTIFAIIAGVVINGVQNVLKTASNNE